MSHRIQQRKNDKSVSKICERIEGYHSPTPAERTLNVYLWMADWVCLRMRQSPYSLHLATFSKCSHRQQLYRRSRCSSVNNTMWPSAGSSGTYNLTLLMLSSFWRRSIPFRSSPNRMNCIPSCNPSRYPPARNESKLVMSGLRSVLVCHTPSVNM